MKRDMDLIRGILQKLESCDDPYGLDELPDIEGYKPEQVSYHVKLLWDAGLLTAEPLDEAGVAYTDFMNLNLTWTGQDFLAVAGNETLWRKAKEKVIKPGTSFTFDLLVEWLKAKAKEQIGLL